MIRKFNQIIKIFFIFQAPGSDSCSCVTTEDCTSERVRFDDYVSFIASSQAEKTSIGSSCSFRARCATKPTLSKNDRVCDTLSNDSIYIDIDEKPRKYSSQAAILRSQFFHSINDGKPATKSLDDKTIIEVSNETLDKQSQPLIAESSQPIKLSASLNFENSKLQLPNTGAVFVKD